MTQIAISTLDNLIERIREDADLCTTRKRDLVSDLKCLARLLERDPRQIPADLRVLKRAINDLHHAQVGVSLKRFQNLKSSVMYVFKRYGISSSMSESLSPIWQNLYNQLQTKRERNGLVALCRYCATHKIGPGNVTDEVTVQWLCWMETQTLRKKPKQVHRHACKIWNEVVDRGMALADGGQLRPLTVPSNRTPSFTIPWSEFKPSFVTDVEDYCAWLSGRDLFAHEAPIRPSKPSTIALNKNHIRILASAAVQQGYPLEYFNSLADLVSQDGVKCALGYYQVKLDGQYTPYLRDLTKTLLRVTRHWVKDAEQVVWIRERLRRMGSNPVGLTPKNRETLRRFDDPHNIALLLGLPARLLKEAEKSRLSPSRKAVQVQLALAIELLIVAPMRLNNLTQLRIDSNLSWVGSGKNRETFISLHEQTVKNSVPLEYPLPAATRKMLDAYLAGHRLNLVSGDNQWLFPGKQGHKLAHTLGQQMKSVILKETGIRITPHQFRHLAAKLYLDQHPGHYEVVRRVLGHKSIKTTVNFYTGMETRAAVSQFDATVNELRARHVPSRRRSLS